MAGKGVHEKGIDRATGTDRDRDRPEVFSPGRSDLLLGDPAKAKANLGWKPKTGFKELVNMMVDADLAEAEREKRADG